MLRRYSRDITIVKGYSNRRHASHGTAGAFDILEDNKSLMRALGEAREKDFVVGKAEEDFFYIIARSLTSTRDDIGQVPRPNGNSDTFIHSELCRVHSEFKIPHIQTFPGKGLFTNHQSDKVECCFGTQLAVRFAFADKPISIADTSAHNLLAIDKEKAGDIGIYDGIRTGYLNTWSMGCDIQAAVCCVCGNVVARENDAKCEHVTAHRGMEMISDTDTFPQWRGKKVRASDILIGPSFIELSNVTVPADYTAETQEIIGEIGDTERKVASSIDLSPYSSPAVGNETERYADVEPQGDGTYKAVLSTTVKATFADYQAALDFLADQRRLENERSASQYDHPSNQEYDNEPSFRRVEEEDDSSKEKSTKNNSNASRTDVNQKKSKSLFGNGSQYKKGTSGLKTLLDL